MELEKSFKNFFRKLLGKEDPKLQMEITRFTPVTRIFLDHTLHIHDIASFYLCEKELFKSEMYKFKSNNSQPLIIDCGTNIGMSIIYFKQLYPDAHIIGFEADEYIFDFLKRNMDSYNFKDVKIINKAVYNMAGEFSFFNEGGAGGRIEPDDKIKPYKKVNSVRLRAYLENKKIDFLKLDIEGAEYEVLKDCVDLLNNIEHIFVEYHSFPGRNQNLQEILSILSTAGFKYHIKEAYTTDLPYIERKLNVGMDLQLNIFGYRN